MLTAFISKRNVRSFRLLILTFFFLSGACGLVYEIAWLRVLALVFGNTTFAASTVLAGYMAGLGLGALYFGKLADRSRTPIQLYAFLEGGIGLYAFLTPLTWKLIEAVSIGFYRMYEPSFPAFSLFRFAVSFGVLFIPTFLMGGTLPVLAKYFVRERQDMARDIGILYATNTLGAVVGVLASGFFLLYFIGVWQTVILTGMFNLIIFGALYRPRRAAEEPGVLGKGPCPAKDTAPETRKDSAHKITGNRFSAFFLLVLFGFSGAVSMMYEVGWTRVLAIVLGSSIYAFSVMLATFLLGIALGSYGFSWIARRLKIDLGIFSALQMITAVFALLALNQFEDLPYYFLKLYRWAGGSALLIESGKFVLCSLIMFVPTFCIGAMFACFIHVYRHSKSLGFEVGTAYFANTIGTIFGSTLTGFLIIPSIGIQATLIVAAGINAGIGVITFLMLRTNFRRWRVACACFLLILAVTSGVRAQPWDAALITSGTVVRPAEAKGSSRAEFRRHLVENEILFYKEGASATVSVTRRRDKVSLAVNGKVDASTNDTFTQFLLGHLPMLLHPDAKKVLVIGLGSGSTMAAVASHPVETLDGVELEEAVITASSFFQTLNRNVLNDPRVRMFVNDGRNALLLRPDLYDVIISEPSNPWMAGVANLFSYEHYETMRKHLKPGGLVCQWLHAYSMSTEDLQMVIRTFAQTFDHASLWTSDYPDLMLIGSETPLVIDFARVRDALGRPEVSRDLGPHGFQTPEGFFANFWLTASALRRLSEGARLNSDNHPYLEFSAPRNLYRDTATANYEFLDRYHSWSEYPPIKHLEPPMEANVKFYTALARAFGIKKMYRKMKGALERAQAVNPEDPELLEATGIFHYETGDYDSARQAFMQALGLRPDLAASHYYTGLLLELEGAFGRAAAEFTEAVLLDGENTRYLIQLADRLTRDGEFERALPLYQKALKLKGSDFEVAAKISNIIFKTGTLEEKIRIAEYFMERYPRFVPNIERLAAVLNQAGRRKESLETYRLLVDRFPKKVSYYIAMAQIYEKIGKREDMKAALRQAVRLDPKLGGHPEIKKVI